jgi:phage-related minor tail protein
MFFFARLKIEKTQNAGAQQIIRKQQLNTVSMKCFFLQKGRMASLSLGTI